MTPEVRAIADRFIMDSANIKYIATTLPKGGLEADLPELGWTVRQLLGHVTTSLERYVELTRQFTTAGTWPELDPTEFNARSVEATRKTPLPALIGRIDRAIADLLELFEQLPDEATAGRYGSSTFGQALELWSRHPTSHGMDLVDALPESRFDPMVLNWILYADYANDPERLARQQRLLNEVREHFAAEGEDWDEEEDWDVGENDAP